MNFKKKKELCVNYFDRLCKKLEGTHVLVASCNNDCSMYLVPKGSESQITYSSKPINSYRFSDHWNWYANVKKCPDENYIQCLNIDLPRAKPRNAEGKASKPVFGICVAYFDADSKYHHVYGEKFNRSTREWCFV